MSLEELRQEEKPGSSNEEYDSIVMSIDRLKQIVIGASLDQKREMVFYSDIEQNLGILQAMSRNLDPITLHDSQVVGNLSLEYGVDRNELVKFFMSYFDLSGSDRTVFINTLAQIAETTTTGLSAFDFRAPEWHRENDK